MATIKEMANGAYKITVSCGRNAQDKQIRHYMTFTPTASSRRAIEKEVRKAADDFEQRCKEGKFIEGDTTTFRTFVPVWEDNWAKDHLTTAARESYTDTLERYCMAKFGDMKLSKINALVIDSVLKDQQRRGLAVKTIKRIFTAINSVFRYAFRMGIINENPCTRVELPSEHVKKMENAEQDEIQCFNLQQARAFLAALPQPYELYVKEHTCKRKDGTTYTVKGYSRTFTLDIQLQGFYTLAIFSGFRRGEMLALTWQAVNFKDKTITIKQAVSRTKEGQVIKSPKTDSGYRTIELPNEVFDVLTNMKWAQRIKMRAMGTAWKGYTEKDFDKNYLFIQDDGTMMDVATPRNHFKDFIAAYNQRIDREIAAGTATAADKLPNIRLHDLRHTAASLLIASGVDPVTVSHRLGHRDVSTTLNIYSHAFKNEDSAASDTLQRLFG